MSAHKYTASPLYRVRSRRPEEADADETIGERCARWAWSGGTPGAVADAVEVAQLDDPIDVRDIDDAEEDGFVPDARGHRGAAA